MLSYFSSYFSLSLSLSTEGGWRHTGGSVSSNQFVAQVFGRINSWLFLLTPPDFAVVKMLHVIN